MSKPTKEYEEYLTTWPKEAGPKPKASELAAVHATGAVRPGSKDALAVAMSLRGVTQGEIKAVMGNPHRNKFREMVKAKLAKTLRVPRRDGLKVYKLELISQRQ